MLEKNPKGLIEVIVMEYCLYISVSCHLHSATIRWGS